MPTDVFFWAMVVVIVGVLSYDLYRHITQPPRDGTVAWMTEAVVNEVWTGERMILVTDDAYIVVGHPHDTAVRVPTGVRVTVSTDARGRLMSAIPTGTTRQKVEWGSDASRWTDGEYVPVDTGDNN